MVVCRAGVILCGFSAGLWVAGAVRCGEVGLWEVVTAWGWGLRGRSYRGGPRDGQDG